jgi:hypothetical protein
MSYKNAIINSRPVAYYPLTFKPTYSTLMNSFADYNDYLNSLENYSSEIPVSGFNDEIGGYATYSTGSTAVSITNIAPLVSRRSDDTTIGACKIYDKSQFNIPNHYKILVNGYEEKTWSIESWVLLNSSTSLKTSFFTIKDNQSNILLEMYSISDIIYLKLTGKVYNKNTSTYSNVTYTTTKQISTWSIKNHILLSYSEKSIKISVNGIYDEVIKFDNNFEFISTTENDIIIGPSANNDNYSISDIAIYERDLSLNEIRSHLFWSNVDSEPLTYVSNGSAYAFDIKNIDSMFNSKKKFTVKSDYDTGSYNGLISDGYGLTLEKTISSQEGYGYWLYNFHISDYSNFTGVDINWDTGSLEQSVVNSRYVVVSASYDGGQNFYVVENNKKITYFLSTSSDITSSNLLIKVEIYSPDTSVSLQPRVDNLFIGIYNSLEIISDSGGFAIAPLEGSTYMIRKDTNGFLYRSSNFGISFASQNVGQNSGAAQIYSHNSTPYKSIEFWFKYNGVGGVVLDSGSTQYADIYIDEPTGHLKTTFNPGTLYINGQDKSSADLPLIVGEAYHIILSYPESLTDPIYINGSKTNWLTPCDAVYGYFSLYPNKMTLEQAQSRYLSYLSTRNSTSYDGLTNFGSLFEYTGTNSMFNTGNAIGFNESMF